MRGEDDEDELTEPELRWRVECFAKVRGTGHSLVETYFQEVEHLCGDSYWRNFETLADVLQDFVWYVWGFGPP